MPGEREAPRLCMGVITGAHGVRGLVRIKPFTGDPADLTAYGPLSDEAGHRQFRPELLSQAKGQWIARLDGISDRSAAQALAKTRLYVDRSHLPSIGEDDAFYHADLVGLTALDREGRTLGTVRAVFDFGSGDLLEIAQPGEPPLMVPFTRQAVPEIDLEAGRLVVEQVDEILAEDGNDA